MSYCTLFYFTVLYSTVLYCTQSLQYTTLYKSVIERQRDWLCYFDGLEVGSSKRKGEVGNGEWGMGNGKWEMENGE